MLWPARGMIPSALPTRGRNGGGLCLRECADATLGRSAHNRTHARTAVPLILPTVPK
jgi:hypothetical protein